MMSAKDKTKITAFFFSDLGTSKMAIVG